LIYRKEIDGLRALAVIPVIFFHAGFKLFEGGYIGVDIFFVISGYLITSLLIEDIENKRFSVISFYERRARRILPALFFVMLCCIPFAWKLMLPDPLENFGQSLVATSFFSNNILLFATSGYWDLPSEFKPLLHTWSLGVEEQYYILFPLLLLLTWKFGSNTSLCIIICLTIISFILSELSWHLNKDIIKIRMGDLKDANFYLIPFRAWEILIGSIAVFIERKNNIIKNSFIESLGLAAILYSIFFFDDLSRVPGIEALIPITGTLLVLFFGSSRTFIGKILSLPLLVGMGLISYSLYLWHFPIFSFAKIYSIEDLGSYTLLLLSLTSIIIAYLSYRFIEKPFRNKNSISTGFFTISMFIIGTFIVFFGYLMHFNQGFPERIFIDKNNFNVNTHEIKSISLEKFRKDNFNSKKNLKVLISGDSFAGDVTYIFNEAYNEYDIDLIKVSLNACEMLELSKEHPFWKADLIIFAFYQGHDIPCSLNLIDKSNNLNKNTYFFGTKQFGHNLNWITRVPNSSRASLCQKPDEEIYKIEIKEKNLFPKDNYISIFDWIWGNECIYITTPDGNLISSDRYHLTIAGVKYLAEIGLKKSKINDKIVPYINE
tara:strand:- start:10788 stop:12596 length:1809 start_codon:yes stop_codon:yes gene_type:complete